MNIDNIPQELKQTALWCLWKRDEKRGKIPCNPKTGGYAKSNDRTTFADFQSTYDVYQKGGYNGLGIGIFNGIGAIDIDHCIEDGVFSDMATDIINQMGSYTEISPSGSGVRIIFTISDSFVYDKQLYYINNQKQGLEVYVSGATRKFVTITGNKINDSAIVDGTQKLEGVLKMYMQKNNTQEQATTNDLLSVGLEKDSKLKSYWNGNRIHDSESEDDAGLMAKLLYWCNNDVDKAIQAFKSSPYAEQKDAPHKKKLARPDYLQRVAKAVMPERTAAQDNEKWQGEPINHKQEKHKNGLNIISAPDLQKADLPPTQYLIDGFLPVGTSILAAAPKSGKSWFVLLMGLKIAAGEMFLQWQTRQAGVLYLSFEDTLVRLKDRMNKLLNGCPAPLWFNFSTERITLEDGLLELIEEHINKHPETKLIIIDTFQKIRGQSNRGERWYDHDYREAVLGLMLQNLWRCLSLPY